MPPYLMNQDDATGPAKPANENDANLYRSTRAFIRAHLFRPALKIAASRSGAPVHGGANAQSSAQAQNSARAQKRAPSRNPYELLAGANMPSCGKAPIRHAEPDWSKQ